MAEHIVFTQRAIIVASWIANSVDAASKVNAGRHFLHNIQLAKQMRANESLRSRGAVAAMHHAFITKVKSILAS